MFPDAPPPGGTSPEKVPAFPVFVGRLPAPRDVVSATRATIALVGAGTFSVFRRKLAEARAAGVLVPAEVLRLETPPSATRATIALVGVGTFASFRMALAQARAAGVPFDVAWRAHFPRASRSESRVLFRTALDETRTAWERAYANEPASRPERALVLVADLLAEVEERETLEYVGARLA